MCFKAYRSIALSIVLIALSLSAAQRTALGSDTPAHFYVALKALDQAPEPLKSMLLANLETYLAGSNGPDIAQTTYVISEVFHLEHVGSLSHAGGHTGDIVKEMLKYAQWRDRAEQERITAFALGWATHHATDCEIHPLINEFGGDYYAPGGGGKRHKRLELVESEHTFQKDQRVLRYDLKPDAVPVEAIVAAIAPFYSRWHGVHLPPIKPFPFVGYDIDEEKRDFRQVLQGSAVQILGVTKWMRTVHTDGKYVNYDGPDTFTIGKVRGNPLFPVGNAVDARTFFQKALGGTPPRQFEYRRLMEPIKVDKVDWNFPDTLPGEARLTVRYTVNDIKLHKLFCDTWDERIKTAIANATAYLKLWHTRPDAFSVPNFDLTYGNVEAKFDEKKLNPGNPEITRMLCRLSIKNEKGKEIAPASWSGEGKWVDIDFSKGTKMWEDYPSGDGKFEIPFKPDGSEWYTVELKLALADDKKRVYGADLNKPIEATWSDRIRHAPGYGELEIVSADAMPKEVQVGQPVDLKIVYRLTNMRSAQVPVTEKIEIVSNALGGRPLTLGPRQRTISRPPDKFETTFQAHYQARLMKAGSYSWHVDLEAQGYRSPSGPSLSFTVKEQAAPATGGGWYLVPEKAKLYSGSGEVPSEQVCECGGMIKGAGLCTVKATWRWSLQNGKFSANGRLTYPNGQVENVAMEYTFELPPALLPTGKDRLLKLVAKGALSAEAVRDRCQFHLYGSYWAGGNPVKMFSVNERPQHAQYEENVFRYKNGQVKASGQAYLDQFWFERDWLDHDIEITGELNGSDGFFRQKVFEYVYKWRASPPGGTAQPGLGNPTIQDLTPGGAPPGVSAARGSSGDTASLRRQGESGLAGTPAASPPPSMPGTASSTPPPTSSQPRPPGLPAADLQAAPAPVGDRAAQVQRAVDRLWKNDLQGALDELNQLASDPNNFEARRLRAMTRLAMGQVAPARAEAEALLAQRPDDPSLLLLHGQTALLINDTSTARRDFDRVTRLAPNTSQGIYNQANQMLGAGVLPVAHLQYLTVVWLDPQATGAYYGLGMTCARLGRRDQAIEAFERYIKLEPNSPQIPYVLQQLNQLRGLQ